MVISWVIMLLLVVGSILLTRNLKVDHISKRQAALEALYSCLLYTSPADFKKKGAKTDG